MAVTILTLLAITFVIVQTGQPHDRRNSALPPDVKLTETDLFPSDNLEAAQLRASLLDQETVADPSQVAAGPPRPEGTPRLFQQQAVGQAGRGHSPRANGGNTGLFGFSLPFQLETYRVPEENKYHRADGPAEPDWTHDSDTDKGRKGQPTTATKKAYAGPTLPEASRLAQQGTLSGAAGTINNEAKAATTLSFGDRSFLQGSLQPNAHLTEDLLKHKESSETVDRGHSSFSSDDRFTQLKPCPRCQPGTGIVKGHSENGGNLGELPLPKTSAFIQDNFHVNTARTQAANSFRGGDRSRSKISPQIQVQYGLDRERLSKDYRVAKLAKRPRPPFTERRNSVGEAESNNRPGPAYLDREYIFDGSTPPRIPGSGKSNYGQLFERPHSNHYDKIHTFRSFTESLPRPHSGNRLYHERFPDQSVPHSYFVSDIEISHDSSGSTSDGQNVDKSDKSHKVTSYKNNAPGNFQRDFYHPYHADSDQHNEVVYPYNNYERNGKAKGTIRDSYGFSKNNGPNGEKHFSADSGFSYDPSHNDRRLPNANGKLHTESEVHISDFESHDQHHKKHTLNADQHLREGFDVTAGGSGETHGFNQRGFHQYYRPTYIDKEHQIYINRGQSPQPPKQILDENFQRQTLYAGPSYASSQSTPYRFPYLDLQRAPRYSNSYPTHVPSFNPNIIVSSPDVRHQDAHGYTGLHSQGDSSYEYTQGQNQKYPKPQDPQTEQLFPDENPYVAVSDYQAPYMDLNQAVAYSSERQSNSSGGRPSSESYRFPGYTHDKGQQYQNLYNYPTSQYFIPLQREYIDDQTDSNSNSQQTSQTSYLDQHLDHQYTHHTDQSPQGIYSTFQTGVHHIYPPARQNFEPNHRQFHSNPQQSDFTRQHNSPYQPGFDNSYRHHDVSLHNKGPDASHAYPSFYYFAGTDRRSDAARNSNPDPRQNQNEYTGQNMGNNHDFPEALNQNPQSSHDYPQLYPLNRDKFVPYPVNSGQVSEYPQRSAAGYGNSQVPSRLGVFNSLQPYGNINDNRQVPGQLHTEDSFPRKNSSRKNRNDFGTNFENGGLNNKYSLPSRYDFVPYTKYNSANEVTHPKPTPYRPQVDRKADDVKTFASMRSQVYKNLLNIIPATPYDPRSHKTPQGTTDTDSHVYGNSQPNQFNQYSSTKHTDDHYNSEHYNSNQQSSNLHHSDQYSGDSRKTDENNSHGYSSSAYDSDQYSTSQHGYDEPYGDSHSSHQTDDHNQYREHQSEYTDGQGAVDSSQVSRNRHEEADTYGSYSYPSQVSAPKVPAPTNQRQTVDDGQRIRKGEVFYVPFTQDYNSIIKSIQGGQYKAPLGQSSPLSQNVPHGHGSHDSGSSHQQISQNNFGSPSTYSSPNNYEYSRTPEHYGPSNSYAYPNKQNSHDTYGYDPYNTYGSLKGIGNHYNSLPDNYVSTHNDKSSADYSTPSYESPNYASRTHSSPNYGSSSYDYPNYESSNYGSPDYASTNHGSPNYGSPDYGSLNNGSPRYGSPNYNSPSNGFTNHGSPNYNSPDYGSLNNASPHYGSPNYASPNYGSSNHGSPNYGSSNHAPNYHSPNYGFPKYGSSNYDHSNYGSRYGSLNYNSLNYDSPDYGYNNYSSPGYDSNDYGSPNSGALNYGSPNYVSPDYSSPNYGFPNDRSSNYGYPNAGSLSYGSGTGIHEFPVYSSNYNSPVRGSPNYGPHNYGTPSYSSSGEYGSPSHGLSKGYGFPNDNRSPNSPPSNYGYLDLDSPYNYGNPVNYGPLSYSSAPYYGSTNHHESPINYGSENKYGAPHTYDYPNGYDSPTKHGSPNHYGPPNVYDLPSNYGSENKYGTPHTYDYPNGYDTPNNYGSPNHYDPPNVYDLPNNYGFVNKYGNNDVPGNHALSTPVTGNGRTTQEIPHAHQFESVPYRASPQPEKIVTNKKAGVTVVKSDTKLEDPVLSLAEMQRMLQRRLQDMHIFPLQGGNPGQTSGPSSGRK